MSEFGHNITDAFDRDFIAMAKDVLAEGGAPSLKFSRFVGLRILWEAEKAGLLTCTAQEALERLFPDAS